MTAHRAQSPAAGEVLKHLTWTTVSRWAQAAIAIASLAAMTRILGPHAYGLFAVALLAVSIGEIFATGALSSGLEQRQVLEPGHVDASFMAVMAITAAVGAPVALFAAPLASMLGAPEAAGLTRFAVLLLALSALGSTPIALLRRDLRFKALSHLETLSALLAAAAGIGSALAGAGAWSLAIMEAVRRATNVVCAVALTRWSPGASCRRRHFEDLGGFSLRVLGAQLLGRLDNLAPRLAISIFLGPAALGAYTVAQRICEQLIGLIGAPLSAIALPSVARAMHVRETLHEVIAASTRSVAVLAFPALIGFAAIAPIAVPLLVGEKWSGSIVVVQLLVLAGVRTTASGMNIATMQAVGRGGLPLISLAVALVLHGALLLGLAPLGLEWTAAAGVIRAFLTWPLSIALLAVATGFSARSQYRILAAPLAAALVMGGTVAAFLSSALADQISGLPAMLAAVGVGASLYAALILAIDSDLRRLLVRRVNRLGVFLRLSPQPSVQEWKP